jgi:hypothetical protein
LQMTEIEKRTLLRSRNPNTVIISDTGQPKSQAVDIAVKPLKKRPNVNRLVIESGAQAQRVRIDIVIHAPVAWDMDWADVLGRVPPSPTRIEERVISENRAHGIIKCLCIWCSDRVQVLHNSHNGATAKKSKGLTRVILWGYLERGS